MDEVWYEERSEKTQNYQKKSFLYMLLEGKSSTSFFTKTSLIDSKVIRNYNNMFSFT